MIYPTNLQNINFKHFVFLAIYEKLVDLSAQILSDFVIFYVAYNIMSFSSELAYL
jgi:hypothetical protein